MSGVYFVSDLHLGHKTILIHTKETGAYRGGTTVDEHDDWIIQQLLSVQPTKRTLWYIMGDVAMSIEKLWLLEKIPGRKRLILGNHDLFETQEYLKHFEWVLGGHKKYKMWLTHMPVHPDELRGHVNVHGHSHHHVLHNDPRYFNTAIEWLPSQKPVSLDQLREHFKL